MSHAHVFKFYLCCLVRIYRTPDPKTQWTGSVQCWSKRYFVSGTKANWSVTRWILTNFSLCTWCSQALQTSCATVAIVLSLNHHCLRRFLLLENVAALLSAKCRDCMSYLIQAPGICQLTRLRNLTLLLLSLARQAASDRNLKLTYCSVNGHQVGAPAGNSKGFIGIEAHWNWNSMESFVWLLDSYSLDLAATRISSPGWTRVQLVRGHLSVVWSCMWLPSSSKHTSCTDSNLHTVTYVYLLNLFGFYW